MRKYSRQRESVKTYLATHSNHPTAETIYLAVKQEYPNISLGTVYRNLALLEETGEIIKISTGVGPDRYDGNVKPHYHFFCNECGDVYDLELNPSANINSMVNDNFDGIIENSISYFFGKCPHCAGK